MQLDSAALQNRKNKNRNEEPAQTVFKSYKEVVKAVQKDCYKQIRNLWTFLEAAVNKQTAQAGTGSMNYVGSKKTGKNQRIDELSIPIYCKLHVSRNPRHQSDRY